MRPRSRRGNPPAINQGSTRWKQLELQETSLNTWNCQWIGRGFNLFYHKQLVFLYSSKSKTSATKGVADHFPNLVMQKTATVHDLRMVKVGSGYSIPRNLGLEVGKLLNFTFTLIEIRIFSLLLTVASLRTCKRTAFAKGHR